MPIIITTTDVAADSLPLGPAATTRADIPHLKFPLQVAHGNLAVVEQDTPEDIAQCVTTILRTPLGLSDSIPDLGLTDQAFYEGGADVQEIQQQLAAHERRTDVLITEDPSKLDQALSIVGVRLTR
jgi:phage baseplate assembly protein W